MIEDRNIICFASNWFYDPTSKHHVMKLLSERNHVIWVNYHGSRRPRLSGADGGAVMAKLRQFAEGPRLVSNNITVVTPLVLPIPGSRAVAAMNRELLTRQIRGVLQDLPERPVHMWSFAPDVDYMCGRFGEECVVYYCVDEFSEFSGYDAGETLAAERRLAERADLVFTSSQALFEAKRHLNERVVLVTHGVDYEHFSQATSANIGVPRDVADLPRPVLGFWGLIQDWLDVGLLAKVACARPDWAVVLIGDVATDVSALSDLPNIHLLGRRPYEQLPAYASGFDLGLIPFRVNSLTLAVNPIKLREYLSAGLPVVSTPLPEVCRYGGLVRIAADAAGFVQACQEVLVTERGEEERRAQRGSVPQRAERGFSTEKSARSSRRRPQRGSDSAARQTAMRAETWSAKLAEISDHVSECLRPRPATDKLRAPARAAHR
ncbi:MAG: glycosyltransferase [Phycisphaerae bacterium]|nr:glycosyltransferase [Phycisphaerae bacterium]